MFFFPQSLFWFCLFDYLFIYFLFVFDFMDSQNQNEAQKIEPKQILRKTKNKNETTNKTATKCI